MSFMVILHQFIQSMKRSLFEKGFVVVLFVLVIVAFSFAERDTQKVFKKYNTKSTVETPWKSIDNAARFAQKSAGTIENTPAREQQ
jgi:hypothetical protein